MIYDDDVPVRYDTDVSGDYEHIKILSTRPQTDWCYVCPFFEKLGDQCVSVRLKSGIDSCRANPNKLNFVFGHCYVVRMVSKTNPRDEWYVGFDEIVWSTTEKRMAK